ADPERGGVAGVRELAAAGVRELAAGSGLRMREELWRTGVSELIGAACGGRWLA
ncbi:hypothetical protein M9458_054157, partial [Cirrhinus mrigala]